MENNTEQIEKSCTMCQKKLRLADKTSIII